MKLLSVEAMKMKRRVLTRWRSLPKYPYEVSSVGQIRRVVGGRGAVSGRILKPRRHVDGYSLYTLSKANKRFDITAHQAVALAFKGPRPTAQHQAAHDDGDSSNNSAYNINWKTPKENEADKRKHGTYFRRGIRNHVKLTDVQVKEIRRLRKSGISYRKLGLLFGVNPSTCFLIIKGTTWSGRAL